ncbi:MAG: hypothetical protein PWP27_74 [Clostridiales bacterium]|jgi:carbonic anhydrase/acetyltransferase-like protein (isoleucine patch superfamily)|nr:hypothetical protein [Clostridiales bacterium]MDK2932264.1 hypothetical protein [Clostridiales bacterium]
MILKYKNYYPKIHKSCFIANSANIIGNVEIGEDSSIWFNAVLRGDVASITVGRKTNIQDGCIIHGDTGTNTVIGDGVVVGHNAILHGCQIYHNCLIGMGATVLNNARIGENCIIGAGALITSDKEIPPNSLVLGSPAKVIRKLTEQEIQSIFKRAQGYIDLSKEYMK